MWERRLCRKDANFVAAFLVLVLLCGRGLVTAQAPKAKSPWLTLTGHCDLFSGKWMLNRSGPTHSTNTSCNFMRSKFDCINNGRPDREYLSWRWKPYDCELPRLIPGTFLNSMQHKSWAFIGDSIAGNQLEALVCLLSQVEEPLQIFHDSHSERWHFPLHNVTVANIWAPFLLKAEIFSAPGSQKKRKVHLHLDSLETKWTTEYHTYDYIVVSLGQWFTNPIVMWNNDEIVGCHDCQGEYRELGIAYPYRRALQSAFHFVTMSDHKPIVFFRTFAPDHYEYGEWFNGGVCNRTAPFEEGKYTEKYVDHMLYTIDVEEYEKVYAGGYEKRSRMRLLNIYHLSLLRPDGHPDRYEDFGIGRIQSDCLHWCIPGPIDTWNDLMMEMIRNDWELNYG